MVSHEIIVTLSLLNGIGNKSIFKIMECSNNYISILSELCELWPSLKGKTFEKITTDDLKAAYYNAQKIIEISQSKGIGVISYFDSGYPEILRHTVDETGKSSPPVILYYRGNIKAFESPGVAVIGTRNPTEYGEKVGLYVSSELAKRGFNIVSGLAIGCDTSGHKGALAVGGTTTAFLANGLDYESIYPSENKELARWIVDNGGLLLSEYPVGTPVDSYRLVARDRLQAGLSYATVVIQTGVTGGTMHAVNATLAGEKPVITVDYRNLKDADNPMTSGNKKLIEDKQAYPLKITDIEETVTLINKSMNK